MVVPHNNHADWSVLCWDSWHFVIGWSCFVVRRRLGFIVCWCLLQCRHNNLKLLFRFASSSWVDRDKVGSFVNSGRESIVSSLPLLLSLRWCWCSCWCSCWFNFSFRNKVDGRIMASVMLLVLIMAMDLNTSNWYEFMKNEFRTWLLVFLWLNEAEVRPPMNINSYVQRIILYKIVLWVLSSWLWPDVVV